MATTQPTNPAVFSPALLRQPIADRTTLLLSQPWARWMMASWGRQGGAQAPSNAELDSGLSSTNEDLSQTQDALSQTQDDLGQTQTTVAGLEAELTALQTAYLGTVADVSALETLVATLETRLAALEAWRTAVVAGLPALVTVSAVPALANDPATAILLENDLSANWRPGINTNDTAVGTAVNAVRTALAA